MPHHGRVERPGSEDEARERLDGQGVGGHEAHALSEDARLDGAKRAALGARRIDVDQEDRRAHVERRLRLGQRASANRPAEVEVDDGRDREAVDVAFGRRDVLADDRPALARVALEIGTPLRGDGGVTSATARRRSRASCLRAGSANATLLAPGERRFALVDDGADARLRGRGDGDALPGRSRHTRNERKDKDGRDERAGHRPTSS